MMAGPSLGRPSGTVRRTRGAGGAPQGTVRAFAVQEEDMSFRVVVDFDRCESNALCMAAAPEVFEVRDDDFLYVLQEEPADDLRAKCEEAARVCPKQAIAIVDA